ncbi:unnamed protein product, partial [Ectocarpus sp. 12 AP-2014]
IFRSFYYSVSWFCWVRVPVLASCATAVPPCRRRLSAAGMNRLVFACRPSSRLFVTSVTRLTRRVFLGYCSPHVRPLLQLMAQGVVSHCGGGRPPAAVPVESTTGAALGRGVILVVGAAVLGGGCFSRW